MVEFIIGIFELFNFKLLDKRILSTIMIIPPEPWYGTNVGYYMNVIVSQIGICFWVLWQWFAHAGPYLSIAISLALLVCWYHLRFARKTSGAARQWRSRWTGMFNSLGRSMIAMGIFWIFIYLLFTPSLIQSYEDRYQSTMSFVRNPNKYRETLEKTMAEVKEDWSWMNKPQLQKQELQ